MVCVKVDGAYNWNHKFFLAKCSSNAKIAIL